MSRPPRVTVGLPVYNGERYLAQSIDAILGQTFEDLELVIADNASTDATEEICRAAAADPRVRYHRHERNLGAAANYNSVVRLASGPLFRWATHDDLIAPTLLERCVAHLEAAPPGVVLAFSDTVPIDEAGAALAPELTPLPWTGGAPAQRLRELLLQPASYIVKCEPVFGVMRTATLRSTTMIGPFESSDKVLVVEVALRGDLVHIPEPLDMRRIHPDTSRAANVSHEDRARWFDSSAGAAFPMPRTRLARGYLRAVLRAPLPAAERARCVGVLGRWLASDRRWRVIGGELRIASHERGARALRRARSSATARGHG